MKTPTNTQKKRFFAAYLGCEVTYPGRKSATLTGVSITEGLETTWKRKHKGCSGDYLSWKSNGNHNVDALHTKLPLRPISSLTDAELIEVAKLFSIGEDNNVEYGKYIIKTFTPLMERLPSCIADYLRSIGVLIPFDGLSEEEIIAQGWAEYKV